jgi:hypothetical protein
LRYAVAQTGERRIHTVFEEPTWNAQRSAAGGKHPRLKEMAIGRSGVALHRYEGGGRMSQEFGERFVFCRSVRFLGEPSPALSGAI